VTDAISQADARLIRRLEAAFAAHAGSDAAIDVRELQKALGLRSEYLTRRVLSLLDANGDGVLRRDEFLAAVRGLVFGSPRERLAFAFRLHDHNGDGAIERDEMRRMLAIGMIEDDVDPGPHGVDALVSTLFLRADRDRDGHIRFDEFEAAVAQRPWLLDRMTRSEARWMAPDEDLVARALHEPRGVALRLRRTLANHRGEAIVVALWIVATVTVMASGAASVFGRGTSRSEPFWMLSQACTSAITLNTALVLVPVLRRALTRLREVPFARALPLDSALDFHRWIGDTLFALAAGHAFASIGDCAARGDVLTRLAAPRMLSGLVWFSVFSMLWSFSRASVRRSGRFELFYFSHLLYIAWFALAALHAPSLLAVAAVPLAALVVEFALRRRRRGRRARVRSVSALRSGVTRIELDRPEKFRARAGDWAFVRIPSVARHEWHPFTLSSAPERSTVTLHIRTLGNWTHALHRRAVETQDPASWEVFIDGPYGAPSARVFECAVPVLIGAGIGVTPFASVLESLLLRQRAGDPPSPLQRAHFFWLNRDLYSFDWFRALLAELEATDAHGALSISVWMTDGHAGATALGLELAREMVREAGSPDPVWGLRTPMRMGHPDWEAELRAIRDAHAPTVPEVFFCGPPGLGRTLRATCERLGLRYREERF
jgi:NADPH oxidase 5